MEYNRSSQSILCSLCLQAQNRLGNCLLHEIGKVEMLVQALQRKQLCGSNAVL